MHVTMLAAILILLISHGPGFPLTRRGRITGMWGAWFLAGLIA